jgi:hypothetical protein
MTFYLTLFTTDPSGNLLAAASLPSFGFTT